MSTRETAVTLNALIRIATNDCYECSCRTCCAARLPETARAVGLPAEAPAPSQPTAAERHCYDRAHDGGICTCESSEAAQPVASPTTEEIAATYAAIIVRWTDEKAVAGYLNKMLREALAAQSEAAEARLAAQKNIIATLGAGKAAAEQRAEKAEALLNGMKLAPSSKETLVCFKCGPTKGGHPAVYHYCHSCMTEVSALTASLRDVQETLGKFMKMWCWESEDASVARIRALLTRLANE